MSVPAARVLFPDPTTPFTRPGDVSGDDTDTDGDYASGTEAAMAARDLWGVRSPGEFPEGIPTDGSLSNYQLSAFVTLRDVVRGSMHDVGHGGFHDVRVLIDRLMDDRNFGMERTGSAAEAFHIGAATALLHHVGRFARGLWLLFEPDLANGGSRFSLATEQRAAAMMDRFCDDLRKFDYDCRRPHTLVYEQEAVDAEGAVLVLRHNYRKILTAIQFSALYFHECPLGRGHWPEHGVPFSVMLETLLPLVEVAQRYVETTLCWGPENL